MRRSGSRTILATRATAVACLAALLAFPAVAQILKGMPDVIVCTVIVPTEENDVVHMLFYLASQQEGSQTRYISMGGRSLQLAINNEGKVIESSKGSCENKSLEQLRASGQVFNFGKP